MQTPRTLITGALGGIGFKSMLHLARYTDCPAIYGIDYREPEAEHWAQLEAAVGRRSGGRPEIKILAGDLTDGQDTKWRPAMSEVEAVVHLAAANTHPCCTWEEANRSLQMTLHTVEAARECTNIRRYVFASSNHVMDGYLHTAELEAMAPGALSGDTPPRPGGFLYIFSKLQDTTPYSSSKLAGELLVRTLAQASGGRVSGVCLRIGAMRLKDNRPESEEDMMRRGSTGASPLSEPEKVERLWIRYMRISDRDWSQLLTRALVADPTDWPGQVAVVNGVSANTGMKWGLEDGRERLGYEPVDDFTGRG